MIGGVVELFELVLVARLMTIHHNQLSCES